MKKLITAFLLLTVCFSCSKQAAKEEPKRTVLFVCMHGAARSPIAAAHFNRLAKEQGLNYEAVFRGTEPDGHLTAETVLGLKADGLDVTGWKPQLVSGADIARADHIVTFDCKLPAMERASVLIERWNGTPSISKDYDLARTAILDKVTGLVNRLKSESTSEKKNQSETLIMNKISDHVYQHITYLQTDDYGKVACNGMVVIDKKEAIVFDTPPDNEASVELINWLGRELGCRVAAVVPTHFHEDCLGGLEAFHVRGIPSYANQMTIDLADSTATKPQIGFENFMELTVGDQKVYVDYLGEGHTKDNVVGYFPAEKTLFGGCLVKKLKASKGYLGDANISGWSETVSKIKSKYPAIETVIPGHGESGRTDLLDYTIDLFQSSR